jgi:hypothetical protein
MKMFNCIEKRLEPQENSSKFWEMRGSCTLFDLSNKALTNKTTCFPSAVPVRALNLV